MTREDEQCLRLGREVVRMLCDVLKVKQQGSVGDTAYARRTITFPGGQFDVFVVTDSSLAAVFENAASQAYEVQTVTPPSQVS